MNDLLFSAMSLCEEERKDAQIVSELERKWTMSRKKREVVGFTMKLVICVRKCPNVASSSR